jgi:hypothetical protein
MVYPAAAFPITYVNVAVNQVVVNAVAVECVIAIRNEVTDVYTPRDCTYHPNRFNVAYLGRAKAVNIAV